MAHNLDTTDGQTAFVSARTDAWHTLGTTLPDSFTAEQAMEHGLLGGWEVRKDPLTATMPDTGEMVEVPGHFAVTRKNPVTSERQALGVVGSAYHIIQNEEHATFLNALVDESGAHFDTAGAIDGGRKVFVTLELPQHLYVGGVDHVKQYLAAVNSHDGSTAFRVMVTPVRVVCQNTMNLALRSASHTFSAKHSRNSGLIIGEARRALDLSFKYLSEFQDLAEALINVEMTSVEFERLIEQEFGAPDDAAPATLTRAQTKLETMAGLFSTADTHEEVRGTAWAGLNALTEYADHYAPTRGGSRGEARATNSVFDRGFKAKATSLIREFAGV